MKKSMRLAAAAASLVMAVSSIPAVTVSANSEKEYSIYYVWYNVATKRYYNDKDEAIEASSAADVVYADKFVKDCSPNFSLTYPYYSTHTKKYYPTLFAAQACSFGDPAKVIFGGPDGSPKHEGDYVFYSTYTRRYYKTYDEALRHSDRIASYVIDVSTGKSYNGYSYYGYYSTYTGKYYTTYSAALSASKNDPNYIRYAYYKGYEGSGDYFNNKTGRWYSSLSAALAATNNVNDNAVSYTGRDFTTYAYNGREYATETDAIMAGGTSGVNISVIYNHATAPSKGSNYIYSDYVVYDASYSIPNYYYYNGTYYYGSPYSYYNSYVPSYSTTVVNTTTNKTVSEGTPYLKGNSRRNSWSDLASYVKSVKAGSSIGIVMNGSEEVSQQFLSNLKGRDVTVTFYLSNGARIAVNGKDISSASSSKNIGVVYNVNNAIPSDLVKKAKKVDGAKVSAQFAVSDGVKDFGFKGSCSVKFSADKAGCFAKTYMYDPDTKKLSLVSKSLVNSNGYVSFTAKKGGVYLVVLF